MWASAFHVLNLLSVSGNPKGNRRVLYVWYISYGGILKIDIVKVYTLSSVPKSSRCGWSLRLLFGRLGSLCLIGLNPSDCFLINVTSFCGCILTNYIL